MNHPHELLPLVASGYIPDVETRAHLDTCETCSRSLTALSALDLDYSWSAITSELDAPKPSIVERLLTAIGLPPGLARFGGLTPALRPAWILATTLILALATLASTAVDEALPMTLLVAPFIAAATVAFSYGPGVDRAHEMTATAPVSQIVASMIRLSLVLLMDSVLVGLFDVVIGTQTLTWFFPMAAIATLSAVVGSRTQPIVGAAAGSVTWSLTVATVTTTATHPYAVLTGATAQTAFGLALVVGLVLLARAAREGLRG